MANLKTTYMGIELKNPIIIGSNNLLTDMKNVKALEEAGAAALVYKSLFEEQIQLESYEMEMQMEAYNERNAEMIKLFPDIDHAGPKEYLMHLRKIKEAVSIPVFGSLNCVNNPVWVEWAKEMEKTGIDGLELNFYHVPSDFDLDGSSIVEDQVKIAANVVKALKIPVAVKLSPFYANPLNFIKRLDAVGVKSMVMFNSLFQPDIDINEMKMKYHYRFSNPEDNRLPLRYAGLLYGNIKANICGTRGILSGKEAIKMILAGADTVEVVSAIYKHGVGVVETMLGEMEEWMKQNSFNSLKDFRGKLSKQNIKSPFAYRRAQYIDILMRSENLLQDYVL